MAAEPVETEVVDEDDAPAPPPAPLAQRSAPPAKIEDLTVMQLANALVGSGYFKEATDAYKVIVKVLAGRELGLGPVTSMTGIHVIQGRVALSAQTMASLIKRSRKYDYRIREMANTGCTIEFYEHDSALGVSTFTVEDAKRAGLLGKPGPWQQYPRNMLYARAMSNGARWYCPEIFCGPIYTPEEAAEGEYKLPIQEES